MSTWPEVSVGDVCEFKYGKSLREDSRSGGPVPVYGSNGVVGYHGMALTDGPAVVIGRKGSFGEVHVSEQPCWPIDTTYYVDRSATHANLRWLAYRLGALGLNTLNRAAAVPGLNREDAYRLRFLLPPLTDQRRIVAILDRADALRARRRAALAHLDSLPQAIFLDMFGDPMTNPRAWPTTTLSQIGEVVTGNTPPRAELENYGGKLEWLKSDNLGAGTYFATRAEETLSERGRAVARMAPAGSILVTCIAGSPNSIGNSAMLDREVAFNQQINAVTPRIGDPHFWFGQIRAAKRLVQMASTESMKGMVSKTRFAAIRVMKPPDELQRRFAELSLRLRYLSEPNRAASTRTNSLFASIQERAFRGEL